MSESTTAFKALKPGDRDLTGPLPHAWGGPLVRGLLRHSPQDFKVDEQLPFSASGDGEHVLVQVEKTGANTAWVAAQLARFAGIRSRDVSFAGLKDRHAVTRQSFSVHLPGKDQPAWDELDIVGVRLLAHARHHRKLRRGALSGNAFRLVVRELEGELDALDERLTTIATAGVPNYFTEQRFGRAGENLVRASRMLSDGAKGVRRAPRNKRGMYLSAARSFLFNDVVARRVAEGNWNQALQGEVFVLDGSHGRFGPQAIDDAILARLGAGEIHPSAPLWGDGAIETEHAAAVCEHDLRDRYPALCQGLESARVKRDRRAARVIPGDMQWQLDQDTLEISFYLPAGCYATAVMRECIDATDGKGGATSSEDEAGHV